MRILADGKESANLLQSLDGCSGAARHEKHLGAGRGGDSNLSVDSLLESKQSHRVLGGGSRNSFFEILNRFPQTGDDGFSFTGQSSATSNGGLLFGLGVLGSFCELGLREILGGDKSLSRSIFGVVGLDDGGVRRDFCDQNVGDRITVFRHYGDEFSLHMAGDRRLVHLDFLEAHLGNLASNRAGDVRLDLLFRILQLVECIANRGGIIVDLVLNIGGDSDRGAFVGVGDLAEFELANAQAYRFGDLLEEGQLEIETRAGDAIELPETSDDALGLLLDGKETSKEAADKEDASRHDDFARQQDGDRVVENVHHV